MHDKTSSNLRRNARPDGIALAQNAINPIIQELGVPLADNKTVGPTTLLTFLGLLIDTVNMIVKITVDKFNFE
jgi:hypothetical protein